MKSFIYHFVIIASLSLFMISCVKANSDDKYVEGNIKITQKEFTETLRNLPPDIKENILKDRAVFLSYIERLIIISDQDNNFIFFPVDKTRNLSDKFTPSDLKELDKEGFSVNKKGMQLRANAITALKEMNADATANIIELLVSSAFRSYEYQKNLYNYYISIHGKEKADKYSALPGASQHQLGTVLDFGSITLAFQDTPEGKWIKENGWKYGFSLSYPLNYEEETGYNYEPWHYRYITKEGALVEKVFFNGLQYLFLNYLAEYESFFLDRLQIKN